MDLINNLGISYKAGYLVQGNQLERCNVSTSLNVLNTELKVRTDGKDSDIESIIKNYKGNLVFNLPSINPDLSNLDAVNALVRKMKENDIKMVTINASNLSLDLFEWSTLEEQKKYFLNIVTSIATIASNKIEVAIENLKPNDVESMFGSTMSQITDIIVYSRRLLVKDFGITEEMSEKYIGLSLNVDNVNITSESESLMNWLEIFGSYIKIVKISNTNNMAVILDTFKNRINNVLIFLQSKSDLDDVKKEYIELKEYVINYLTKEGLEIKEKKLPERKDRGFSNIIILSMIILTIIIVILMFIIKLK